MAKSLDEIRDEMAAKHAASDAPTNQEPQRSAPEPHQTGSEPTSAPPEAVNGAHREAEPHEERRIVTKPTRPTTHERDVPVDIRRALPHSLEAEQGVLGSMLISRDAIAECVTQINEQYFYSSAHQTIYTAIVDLWNAGKDVDLITFTQVLRDKNLLDSVGGSVDGETGPGAWYVTKLFNIVSTAANVGYYLEIIRDKYILRQIITASTESVRRAYEEQDEVDNLLDEVEQKILAVGESRFAADVRPMKENVMEAVEMIEAAYERKGGLTGIATGFSELDRMTGGLQKAEMIVIAARPSMGKTALVMNIAEHVSIALQLSVAVFSLEMSTQQLTQRLLCSRARVNLHKVRDGFLTESDFARLTGAVAKLSEAKLLIDDAPALSILALRAKARRLKSQHDIQLVVVDYLQLLCSSTRKSQDNRQIEISEISSGLKSLAKELQVPVLVAAQLNRNPENRTGAGRGKPRLSDLRESGSIEQDADLVGLLTRPEVYADDAGERDDLIGQAELDIAKQRNGPTGEVPLTFLKEFTRFEDRATQLEEPR
jgi:replicative DNA helicase